MGVIHKFSVKRKDLAETPARLQSKLPDLRCWRDYYIEFEDHPTEQELNRIGEFLINPLVEVVALDKDLPLNAVQVAYHRGIVDNENDSICEMSAIAGVPAIAARVGRAYSSDHVNLVEVIKREACNPNIETCFESEPRYKTLLPVAQYEPARWYDLTTMDDAQLAILGREDGRSLELEKMQQIVEIQTKLGLSHVSDALLESLDARWSDHCAHTTWKAAGNLLKVLAKSSADTKNPNIVSMFYDNAGIWDFYDGFGIALKAETHNGPTAVSAYFGQLTKIGGVLRDILGTGKGADPIGVFEYTATGVPGEPSPVAGRPDPKQIANETVRAVKEYGNTFGVPMMQSRMEFASAYSAKPFALGGSIGLIPNAMAEKGKPLVGDLAVIFGGLTGNDGIHGASASSAGAEMDTTSVQIGSPLEEIKFREAILELRDAGLIRAITDMGAAGVNSAFGEMGEDVGIWINTALVPLKTEGLSMWRILISESQERMALALAPENLEAAREIFAKHRVRNAVIGRFTGTHNFTVVHDDAIIEDQVVTADPASMPEAQEVGFQLPYELADFTPAQIRLGQVAQPMAVHTVWDSIAFHEAVALAPAVAGDHRVASQAHASQQYDSSVGGRTYFGPFTRSGIATGYWAAKPLFSSDAAVVFATSFNPALSSADPVFAARQSVVGAIAQLVLAGVDVRDVCLSDNFYTPHLSDSSNEWLSAMVHEIADCARVFGTPFISGKDSSAGSTVTDNGTIHVPHAVFISSLGKVPDAAQLRPETWTAADSVLVQVGLETPSLAGTVVCDLTEATANDVDEINLGAAKKFLAALEKLPLEVARSARMIGSGGVFAAALKCVLDSGLSAELDVDSSQGLFGENRCCALIEVGRHQLDKLPGALHPKIVGRTVSPEPGETATLKANGVNLLTDEVRAAFFDSFEEALS